MARSLLFRSGLILLALLSMRSFVLATTVKSFAFEGLCETAQTIVHVKCLSRETVTFPDREGVFTKTRFEVLEVVKGQADTEVEMILPGGEYNGQRMYVPGMPQFVSGEETVLFLSQPDDYGSPWPVGLGQGCYDVHEEETRQVVLQGANVPLPPDVRGKPTKAKKMPLRDFVGSIQQTLALPPKDAIPEQ